MPELCWNYAGTMPEMGYIKVKSNYAGWHTIAVKYDEKSTMCENGMDPINYAGTMPDKKTYKWVLCNNVYVSGFYVIVIKLF